MEQAVVHLDGGHDLPGTTEPSITFCARLSGTCGTGMAMAWRPAP